MGEMNLVYLRMNVTAYLTMVMHTLKSKITGVLLVLLSALHSFHMIGLVNLAPRVVRQAMC